AAELERDEALPRQRAAAGLAAFAGGGVAFAVGGAGGGRQLADGDLPGAGRPAVVVDDGVLERRRLDEREADVLRRARGHGDRPRRREGAAAVGGDEVVGAGRQRDGEVTVLHRVGAGVGARQALDRRGAVGVQAVVARAAAVGGAQRVERPV